MDTGVDVPDMGVSIDFDDSILEDTKTIINENVMLVGAGLRSKKRAIMEIEHCTEDEADKILTEIADDSKANMAAFALPPADGEDTEDMEDDADVTDDANA